MGTWIWISGVRADADASALLGQAVLRTLRTEGRVSHVFL
jgi:hypothetical protein